MLAVSSTLHHLSQEFSTPVLCINQVTAPQTRPPVQQGALCFSGSGVGTGTWTLMLLRKADPQTFITVFIVVATSVCDLLNPVCVPGKGRVQRLGRQFGVKTL